MSFTVEDAVRTYEEHGAGSVPYKAVKSKLREWGATSEESATVLQEALDKKLLVFDQVGSLSRP